ncbi:MAG: hypothetical protein WD273_08465 [Trueperaceae bacterium]
MAQPRLIPGTRLGARFIGTVLVALLLTACNTVAAPNNDDDNNNTPEPGTLSVNVGGLPDGVDADIDVSGPGFAQALTASATLDDLEPGEYNVLAGQVADGADSYAPATSGSPANVTAGGTATVDVEYSLVDPGEQAAPQDGDFGANPAVHALFRNTSGNPVWVDEPLFNEDSPLDVKGLQYRNAISNPGDESDWLLFGLVHGQNTTTTVEIDLQCDPSPSPSPIRAVLEDEEGNRLGTVITCGDSQSIAIQAEGGTPEYLLTVESIFSDPHYTEYIVSIDAFCFQACTYEEYVAVE